MNTLEVFDVFNYSSDPSNVKLIACTITIRDNVGAHWNKVNITMGAAYKSWCNQQCVNAYSSSVDKKTW